MTYGLVDLLKDKIKGTESLVQPTEAASRYAICTACDRFQPQTKTCGICYCYMPEKVKHAQSECAADVKKWLAVQLV